MTTSPAARRTLLISFLLALATVALYWPVRQFEFVSLDDASYVSGNAQVQRGLTGAGLLWALTNRDSGHWHPLTWLSLMADAEWSGARPAGYHLTNLLLHAANTVLLFLVLAALTGATWPSAWVAALFALHPLHVESVAWITERKDVLSGLFWLLTLAAYGRYAASDQSSVVSDQLQKGTGRETRRSRSTANRSLMPPRRRWYALTLLCFALGLLAKPMVVTLPFVLLLLDYWPLRRWPAVSWWRLAREKIPFFLLATTSSVITLVAGASAKISFEQIPAGQRILTALVAYATYLQKMVWPTALACFYPHPGHWPVATLVGAAVVVIGVTLLAIRIRRRIPAVWVGWCWYLGTLVPVIGLVQVGGQAYADRYTYLPLIGVWIALAWGWTEWTKDRSLLRIVGAAGGAVAVVACLLLTSRQVAVWRDSRTLFRHALAVTKDNWVAHTSLGVALARAGQVPDAIRHFDQALRIRPNYVEARLNLGAALTEIGRWPEAIEHYRRVLRRRPDSAQAHQNLGLALIKTGRIAEARDHFQESLRLQPADAATHYNLGLVLTVTGPMTEAIHHLQESLRLNPADVLTRYQLGVALAQQGRLTEAIQRLEEVLRIRPDWAEAHYRLGLVLEQADRFPEAARRFAQALRLDPNVGRVGR